MVQVAGELRELPTTDLLPIAAIATGAPDGAKFVRDDGVLALPVATVSSDVFAFAAAQG